MKNAIWYLNFWNVISVITIDAISLNWKEWTYCMYVLYAPKLGFISLLTIQNIKSWSKK